MQWVDRVGRRLKLRDLHILLTVVQQGSMAKAAAELAISQPAVSKAIADMEHTLGLRLLDRGRSGIEPTAYGRALAKRGLADFRRAQAWRRGACISRRPDRGRVAHRQHRERCGRVAAGRHRALLARASRRSPRRGASGDQHPALSRVARAQHRSVARPHPDAVRRGRSRSGHRVRRSGRRGGWPAEQMGTRAPAQARRLGGERWILPPADTMPGSLAVELFRAGGAEMPRAPVTTLSMHLCCRLAATGRFVTTLPTSILRFGGRELSLKVLPIRLPLQPRPVGIVTLKNRTLSPVAKLFIEYVHRLVTSDTKRLVS